MDVSYSSIYVDKNNDNSLLILKNDDKNCIIYVGSNNSNYVLLLKCQKERRYTYIMPVKKQYTVERVGQMDFFDNYRVPYNDDASVLVDNTDGVYHGNILEFKLNINNTGKVLFQAIKYLSKMRIKGESVPARILLIDLNATKVYVYNSIDYIDDIQKVYIGAASVGNNAFNSNVTPVAEYDYMDMVDSAEVQKLLINRVPDETDWYIPVDLDENCIVGWAERYYREVPTATKGDFLGDGTGKINTNGEIRDPRHFKGLINPYTEPTNEKFKYLMDCLNDRLNKKDLGAFYTPKAYCEKASELVMKAVERVPDGNDYVIIDRCAGTGNLEAALIGKFDKNGDELISHCVVSTYEYYEYKVLSERIGDKVRNIIPPTEANVIYENGKVSNADAMSKDFIENPLIKQYVDDDKCTIILFENPPYQDSSSITYTDDNGIRGKTGRKDTYVCSEYKKNLHLLNEGKGSFREISNLFIWSGFRYYLRQNTDSYIVFSPIKYWKTIGLADYKFIDGYIFNRKHFHATDSTISCILWENEYEERESLTLQAYDSIDENAVKVADIEVKKAHNTYAIWYDKRTFANDVISETYCGRDGDYDEKHKRDSQSVDNDNIIAYVRTINYSPDAMNRILVRQMYFGARGYYLRKDSYLYKLPLWVSKCVSFDKWYEKDLYYNTSDGGDAYTHDSDFLKSCLIYTCLSNQNKCLSFDGSDGRYYRNELCFDTTNGDTVASADLAKMTLDADEKALMKLWDDILAEAKRTANYDSRLTYGVYQITKELNTSHKTGTGRSQQTVYDYPTLNGYLETLRTNLKVYYKSHITDKMFQYELLK